MKGYIENEIKLFFSKKNIIASIFLITAIFAIFFLEFLPRYENHLETENEKIVQASYPVYSSILRYKEGIKAQRNEINNLRESLEDSKISELSNIESKIKTLESDVGKDQEELEKYSLLAEELDKLLFYYSNQKVFFNDIQYKWKEIDAIIGKNYIGNEFKHEGYALESDVDWAMRLVTRENNESDKITLEKPLEYPSGLRSISNILEGSYKPVIAVLISFIIVCNYNNWSYDFESNDGKVLLTLPISISKIYAYRFFVRLILTIIILLLGLLILFVFTSMRYGIGPNFRIPIIKESINVIFSNLSGKADLLANIGTISLFQYLILLVIFQSLYIIFIYAIVNINSLMIKNNIGSLILNIILFYFIISAKTSLKFFNLLGYYDTSIIFNGLRISPYDVRVRRVGYWWYIIIFLICIFVLYSIGKFILKKTAK